MKLEDGKTKGMMQVEGVRRRGGGEGQLGGNGKGARVVKASQVEEKQVENVGERGKEEGGAKRVVEAKLRGRILVKPREQMWMLQKVKVDIFSSCL